MKIIETENYFEVRTNRGRLLRTYEIEPAKRVFRRIDYRRDYGETVWHWSEEYCLTAFLTAHLTELVECKTIYA